MPSDYRTGKHTFALATHEGLGPLLLSDSPMTLSEARAEMRRLFSRAEIPQKVDLITLNDDEGPEVREKIDLGPRELTRGDLREIMRSAGLVSPEPPPEDRDPGRLGNKLARFFQDSPPLKGRSLGEALRGAFLGGSDDDDGGPEAA